MPSDTSTTLTADEKAVLDVLTADLPETTRVMNRAALAEEVLLGRNEGPPWTKDELPMPEEYDRVERAAEALVDMGLVDAVDLLGANTTFAITDAGIAACSV